MFERTDQKTLGTVFVWLRQIGRANSLQQKQQIRRFRELRRLRLRGHVSKAAVLRIVLLFQCGQ
jgi:hypothetical protein